MKQIVNNQKNKKKRTIYVVSAVVLALLGLLFVLEKTHVTDFVKNPFSKTVPTATTNAQKTDTANKNDPTEGNKTSQTTTPGVDSSKSTSEIPSTSTLKATVDSLTQQNGVVTASVSLSDPSSSAGTCSFTFTKDQAKPVVRSVVASNLQCATSIPELEFSSIGQWVLTVRYFNNDAQASAQQEITIR